MAKMNTMERREFLKFLGVGGLATSPLITLADAIVNGFVNRAYAQGMGINPRKFLLIWKGGAPQRWTYDLFLNPFGSSGFIQNPQAITRYSQTGGRYTGGSYETVSVKGVNAPIIWGQNLPAPGGGFRPMSDLMDNMLAIQGMDSGAGDHGLASKNAFEPLGSLQSLNALSADYAKSPIRAVRYLYGVDYFKSLNQFSSIPVSGNLITNLMDPFTSRTNSTFNTKKNNLRTFLDAATASIASKAQLEHRGAAAAENDRKSAQDLLGQAMGDMTTFWSAGVAKYKSIILRCQNLVVAGLNDLPIGIEGTRDHRYLWNTGDLGIVTTPDLRDMIIKGNDSVWNSLAEQFTLAEYVFANNLTHSLTLDPGALTISVNGTNRGVAADEHQGGTMNGLIGNSFRWMTFSACLLELIDAFKRSSVFNETVIGVASEFGRSPLTNGFGSDHGQYASHMTFYSGAISGPIILGRMRRGSSTGSYMGTWGEGDGTRDFGSALVTASTLLRVPPPLTARSSMVADLNGVITPTAERADLYS